MARKKNSGKNSGPRRDALGRLRGGNPGNAGGKPGRSGRPKSEVRDACRAGFADAIPVLLAITRGELPDVNNGDRIRAADVLGKYGGMTFTETEAKVEDRTPVAQVVYYFPEPTRDKIPEPFKPPRATPENGGAGTGTGTRRDVDQRPLPPGAYRWPDGRVRSTPPPGD